MTISKNSANNKCWRGCGEMPRLGSTWDMVRASKENTKEVPWKGKYWATIQSSIPTAGPIAWEDENQKDTGWTSLVAQWLRVCRRSRGHGFMPRFGKITHAAERMVPGPMAAGPVRPEPVLCKWSGHGSEWPTYCKTRKKEPGNPALQQYLS